MVYRFKVCDLKTGGVLGEVPFEIEGELSRQLQGHGSGKVALPIRHRSCPPNWEHLVGQWRTLILVLDEQDRILTHGIPVDRLRTGNGRPSYPLVTLEGYFLRRYIPDRAYSQRDQTLIAADLAAICADAAGIPLEFDCPLTGVLRDRVYGDDENARVYNRLQELAAVRDGFNWTVDVEWANDHHDRVRYIFRTGYPHLGNRTPTPEHLFALPGNITEPDHAEPWGDGDAATHVRAVGEGDAESKTMSVPVIDTRREAAGWVRLEERRQFSGVKEQWTIDRHAEAMASQLFGGQQVITLTVKNGEGTSLGDLSLGDTARVQISNDELVLDEVLVVVGWSLSADAGTFKPTLARIGDT